MSKAYECIWPEVPFSQDAKGARRADWGSVIGGDTDLQRRASGG